MKEAPQLVNYLPPSLNFLIYYSPLFFLSSLLLSNILFHLMQSFATSDNKEKRERMAANQLDEKTNGDTNDTMCVSRRKMES